MPRLLRDGARKAAPGWIVLAIILTGGILAFAWLAVIAWQVFDRRERSIISLLPAAALFWAAGACFMWLGATAPTYPGESGNPMFLAGFIFTLASLGITLLFAGILG